MSVDAQAYEVAPTDGQLWIECRALRYVADQRIAARWRPAQNRQRSAGRGQPAQDHANQCRLAAAVGPEDRGERSDRNREARARPHHVLAVCGSQVMSIDRRGCPAHDVAVAVSAFWRVMSCASCQSWKEAETGCIVSDTPTTGMSFCAARRLTFVVTAVAVCTL